MIRDDVVLVIGCGFVGFVVIVVLKVSGFGLVMVVDFLLVCCFLVEKMGVDMFIDLVEKFFYDIWE